MSPVFDLSSGETQPAIEAAKKAIDEGKLVILPTDTVYGVGADAFNATAVAKLLDAKGRGREMPPPVLIPNERTIEGLAMSIPSYARRLAEKFWPGALTLIFRSQPSLMWDLGDTNGTVALRMPNNKVALELLEMSGPLAVSSANRTGEPTVKTITEAGFAFGPNVEVYLDAGTLDKSEPSTILDCTKADPVLLRLGAISIEELTDVLGPIDLVDGRADKPAPTPEPAAEESARSLADFDPDEADADETRAIPALADSASDDEAPTQAVPTSAPAVSLPNNPGTGFDPDATTVLPTGGVGAEPPFEREAIPPVELPTKPSSSNS